MISHPKPESLKYRPDIDGLRSIAILAVLVFHAFPTRAPGGYVGVDIFFVISGFLISTIIFRQLENDRFTLTHFYSRRIRRIFPALILMMAATWLFGRPCRLCTPSTTTATACTPMPTTRPSPRRRRRVYVGPWPSR